MRASVWVSHGGSYPVLSLLLQSLIRQIGYLS